MPSTQIIIAYVKGRKARLSGLSKNECPFKDDRQDEKKSEWFKDFKDAWMEGYMFDIKGRSN